MFKKSFFGGGVALMLLSCATNSDIDEAISSLKEIRPVSIDIISHSNIKMGFGRTSTIDFRVSPSDANFNYDVTSDDCQIELDYLGANTKAGASTRAGYVTTPTHIALTKVEPMYDTNKNKLQGQYRAYITDQRVLKKYDDRLGLVLTVPGQSGSDVQISSSAINVILKVGEITSFTFKVADNARVLQENLQCNIEENIISGRIPHIVDGKKLVPTIKFEGEGKLVLHASPEQDVNNETDFSRSVFYDVIDEETKEVLDSYEVNICSFTGLPVMWIETENRTAITSEEEYINATYRIEDSGSITEGSMKIKGRGNSTWSAPKKPYALKFDEKMSVLGEPKDKSWVLLANYYDKTMMRNMVALYMGKMSCLDYTPNFHYVEVILNGAYVGTYLLGDKLKIAKNRVNVGDDGFLLEVDQRAIAENEVYFSTTHLSQPVNIKDPDVVLGDESYKYVKDFVNVAESALFSDNFKDKEEGWQKYFDLDTFVDWYLINEITKNGDASIFYTSCYMNLKRGGKIKMGPLWDYDTALGNNYSEYAHSVEGFVRDFYEVPWISRLFQDETFVLKVKERFNYFYSKRNDLYTFINNYSNYLKYAVKENDYKWNTLYNYTFPNYNVLGCYNSEVEYLKSWIEGRFEWLKERYSNL